eukprot:gnl/Dysnectes_brevis/534_a591_4535.p1 GENE.gnl/Dysnectes_brevis/534_a591_4535~~gnl/Dysnectes_brevis/534_a591_4535.p1  ORF type:complete len:207 (-),score=13.87 gnl/Dysnectes_brevis/534_a591_4535:34-654(-)
MGDDIFSHNGSAILAMTGNNCVAIASDKRLGVSLQTIGLNQRKIFQFSKTTFVALGGLLTDVQTLSAKLRYRVNLYELEEERTMTPKVMCSILSHLLYEHRFGPYFVSPIVAGLQPDGTPFVASMDSIGAVSDHDNWYVEGTASDMLVGPCEAKWRPELGPEDLKVCATECLLAGLGRDALSGWNAELVLVTPEGICTHPIECRQD